MVICPRGDSNQTRGRRRRTARGSRSFACRACRRGFNERTSTPFTELQDPTDVVLLAVRWRLRDTLRFRDVAAMLLPPPPPPPPPAWVRGHARDGSRRGVQVRSVGQRAAASEATGSVRTQTTDPLLASE